MLNFPFFCFWRKKVLPHTCLLPQQSQSIKDSTSFQWALDHRFFFLSRVNGFSHQLFSGWIIHRQSALEELQHSPKLQYPWKKTICCANSYLLSEGFLISQFISFCLAKAGHQTFSLHLLPILPQPPITCVKRSQVRNSLKLD